VCFDIFSPLPGESDVITQLDRLSPNEMKIGAKIGARIAVRCFESGQLQIAWVVSRLGDKQAHSARMPVVSIASWDLESRDADADSVTSRAA